MSQSYFQKQEQEDLLLDFEDRRDGRDVKARRENPWNDRAKKSDCSEPNLKKSTRSDRCMKVDVDAGDDLTIGEETRDVISTGSADFGLDDHEGFTSESYTILLEEIKKMITARAGDLRNVDSLTAVLESFATVLYSLCEVLKYEEELKYVTSIALICYGGSWSTLAGILAAVEAFGTLEVVEKARKAGVLFLFDDVIDCERDITPAHVVATFKDLALHIAVMIAVVVCPSWAEICVTVSFANKFACLVPMQDILKHFLAEPGSVKTELDEYFGTVDQAWFDLLSLFTCNIISLVLFGCFPNLVTAMFMGYVGFVVLVDALIHRANFYIPMVSDSELVFRKSLWMKNTTQYYTWAIIVCMAMWQALYSYEGTFLFTSWCMFLFPIVHVYNVITAEEECQDAKKTE